MPRRQINWELVAILVALVVFWAGIIALIAVSL